MLNRRTSFFAISVIVFVVSALSLRSRGESTTSEPMAACLARTDLAGFLAEAQEKGWKAPEIYSRWHVENIAPRQKRDEMLRARAFGKQLVDLLDQWAARLRPPAKSNEDYERAKLLLDLADWIGNPKCYGSIALAQRSQDIATMPMARLVVNLDFPMEKVKELVARLEASGYDPSTHMEMLNREAAMTIFTPDARVRDAGLSEITRTFAMGSILIRLRSNPDQKALDPEVASARRTALASPLAKLPDLSFFKDDDISSIGGVFTLSRMWEGKWHRYIGNGSTNVYVLPKLAEWRAVVGYFPDTLDEYRRAWDRYGDEKRRELYQYAWGTYSKIRVGKFLDQDSFEFEMKKSKP
jgi:hypothetical protein